MHTEQGPKQKTKRRKAGSPDCEAEEGPPAKKPAASRQVPKDDGGESDDQDERNAEEEDEEAEQLSMYAMTPHACHADDGARMCHQAHATTVFWDFQVPCMINSQSLSE